MIQLNSLLPVTLLRGGVRKLKEKVFEIIREINLEYITEKRSYEFPIIINVDKVRDIFSNKSTIQFKKIAPGPCVGLVNGLYQQLVVLVELLLLKFSRHLPQIEHGINRTAR